MSFNQRFLCLFLLHTCLFVLFDCSQETSKFKIYKKNKWLKNLVSRSKRSFEETIFSSNQINKQNDNNSKQQRPCPAGCTCSYDTINCNELIDRCDECVHWHQIDFNQITEMKPNTFKHFKFASNRTTHIIIYKLLNSTLSENIFEELNVPSNAQLEITFQYNSVIKLDKYALNGVYLNENSTLVFNFPYTTQVIFVSKCFHGVHMSDINSRLILRILKSFSVRFVGDFYSQNFLHLKTARLGLNNMSHDSSNKLKNWSISTGQFIIDIKSTHLVKFEENSFSNLKLKSQARFYLDLDIIEKLMIQRNSFSFLDLTPNTKFTLYAKHITFIDFKAYSFAHITMLTESRMQIYLEELISSLCVQRNVFSYLRLHEENSHFNFSIINSKNVMLMHDSFSNINIDSKTARLFIGVFNSPSYQLKLKTNNYYQTLLKERLVYKWSQTNLNNNENYDQYSSHFAPPFPISNTEYFYSHGLNQINNQLIVSSIHDLNKHDLKTFFITNKQTYSYNVSIERNCFSNLNFNYENSNENNLNVWIAADNVKTLLVDDYIIDYSNNTNPNIINNNVNFLLNVKYLALSQDSLQNVNKLRAEFLREPKMIKFGLLPSKSELDSPRQFKLTGLDLNKMKPVFEYNDNNIEQENLDDPYKLTDSTTDSIIDGYCHLAFASNKDTIFSTESFSESNTQKCSCLSIYFVLNQIKDFETASNLLDCKLPDYDFVLNCRQLLEKECIEENKIDNMVGSMPIVRAEYSQDFLADFIKFWDYCITEIEPLHQHHINQPPDHSTQHNQKNYFFSNTDLDTGNLYFNNFNDPDGMFSASLSSSSSFFDQSIDQFKPPTSISLTPPQSNNNNSVASNIGKIIGIVIVSFLSGIILFMIVINLIQYKFRNELLDDLDYSSQYNNNMSNSSNGTNIANGDQDDGNLNDHNNRNSCQVNLDCCTDESYSCINKSNKHDFSGPTNEKSKFLRSELSNNSTIKESLSEESLDEKDLNKIKIYDEEEDEYALRSDEYSNEDERSLSNHRYESDSLYEEEYSIKNKKKSVKFFKKSSNNKELLKQDPPKIIKTKLSQDSGKFSEFESDRTNTPPPPYDTTSSKKKK